MRHIKLLLLALLVTLAFVIPAGVTGEAPPRTFREMMPPGSPEEIERFYNRMPASLRAAFPSVEDLLNAKIPPEPPPETTITHDVIWEGPAPTVTVSPSSSGVMNHHPTVKCSRQRVSEEHGSHISQTEWCWDGHNIVPYPDPIHKQAEGHTTTWWSVFPTGWMSKVATDVTMRTVSGGYGPNHSDRSTAKIYHYFLPWDADWNDTWELLGSWTNDIQKWQYGTGHAYP